jgi:hypothetical protein
VPRLSAAGYAYAWPRALHSRFAGLTALRAGELSRGVGLRGFEIGLRNRAEVWRNSHSPHHPLTRTH